MAYTARTRDRYHRLVLATTSAVTVAAATAVGWLAGTVAHQADQASAEKTAAPAPGAATDGAVPDPTDGDAVRRPRVVWRERPHRTHVTTRYVTAPPTSYTGSGGSFGSSSGSSTGSSTGSSSGGGSTTHPASPPAHAAAPPPAPPPPPSNPAPPDPPPVPTSGS